MSQFVAIQGRVLNLHLIEDQNLSGFTIIFWISVLGNKGSSFVRSVVQISNSLAPHKRCIDNGMQLRLSNLIVWHVLNLAVWGFTTVTIGIMECP